MAWGCVTRAPKSANFVSLRITYNVQGVFRPRSREAAERVGPLVTGMRRNCHIELGTLMIIEIIIPLVNVWYIGYSRTHAGTPSLRYERSSR